MKNVNLLHACLLGVALSIGSLNSALALDPWETTYLAANPLSYIARLATDTSGTVVGSQFNSDARDGSQYSTLVSSSDGGTTWIESPGVPGKYWEVSISDNGEVYLGNLIGHVIRSRISANPGRKSGVFQEAGDSIRCMSWRQDVEGRFMRRSILNPRGWWLPEFLIPWRPAAWHGRWWTPTNSMPDR